MKKITLFCLSILLFANMTSTVLAEGSSKKVSEINEQSNITTRGAIIPDVRIAEGRGWWDIPLSIYYTTTINGRVFAGTLKYDGQEPDFNNDGIVTVYYRGDLYER